MDAHRCDRPSEHHADVADARPVRAGGGTSTNGVGLTDRGSLPEQCLKEGERDVQRVRRAVVTDQAEARRNKVA